jgi:hypothetical protein
MASMALSGDTYTRPPGTFRCRWDFCASTIPAGEQNFPNACVRLMLRHPSPLHLTQPYGVSPYSTLLVYSISSSRFNVAQMLMCSFVTCRLSFWPSLRLL